jgi:hypothetical protein
MKVFTTNLHKNETTLARLSTPQESSTLESRTITYPTTLTHQAQANPLIAQLTTTGPKTWMTALTTYIIPPPHLPSCPLLYTNSHSFYNRYYRSTTGTQASAYLLALTKNLTASNPAIVVTTFTHSFNQPSIIVKIPGTSPNLGPSPLPPSLPQILTQNSNSRRPLRLHRRLLHGPRPRRRRQRLRRIHPPRSPPDPLPHPLHPPKHTRIPLLRRRRRRTPRLFRYLLQLCLRWENGARDGGAGYDGV